MENSEVEKLPHGLYRIYWNEENDGGSSLASVGSLHSGKRWYAPTNWTSPDDKQAVCSSDWSRIERVERIDATPAPLKATVERVQRLEQELYDKLTVQDHVMANNRCMYRYGFRDAWNAIASLRPTVGVTDAQGVEREVNRIITAEFSSADVGPEVFDATAKYIVERVLALTPTTPAPGSNSDGDAMEKRLAITRLEKVIASDDFNALSIENRLRIERALIYVRASHPSNAMKGE